MRMFILSICLGTEALFCSGVEAAVALQAEVTNNDSVLRSCLRVDSEEAALCAEGNVASFIRQNKTELLELKRMGALEDERPKDLDYSKVKEILIKIWSSDTNIAAYFKKMPKISRADLTNFVDQVWIDSYMIHSDEVGSLDKLKQMLVFLSAVVNLSQKVLL